ncbi:response regulator [Azospirillum sp. ST 5-10]|uniref:response regulator n=1 Tax=unclassified Azospirillum TaxID=2630922 RepID=UPI003F4A69B0
MTPRDTAFATPVRDADESGPDRPPARPRRRWPMTVAGAAALAALASGGTAWLVAVPLARQSGDRAGAAMATALDVLRLAEATDRFAIGTPYLEGAADGLRRQNVYAGLRQHTQRVSGLLGGLTGTGGGAARLDPAAGEALRRLLVGLEIHLDDLNHMVERRIGLEEDLRTAVERVPERHAAFRGALSTVREDALQALRATAPGEAPEATAERLRLRDTLEDLGRSLADQLFAAGTEGRAARLAATQETFRDTAGRLEALLDRLPIGLASARRADAARQLMALGIDTGNVFDLRQDLLRTTDAIADLTRHGHDRAAEVAQLARRLALTLQDEADAARRRAAVALDLVAPAAALAAALTALAAALLGRRSAGPATAAQDRPLPAPLPPPAGAVPPLAILMAEDERINQMVGAALLRRAGHTVTVVADGRQALEAVRGATFDLVLMDLRMPVMDGLETVGRVRALADPVRARVPIVMLTASIVPEDAERCRAAGADAVLPKPLQNETLQPLLLRLFAERAATAGPATAPAAAATAADGPVLDEETLRQMAEALPAERVAGLIDGTVDTLHTYHAALTAAARAGDRRTVSAMAHKMAGVAGVYGCTRLRHAAQALELALERGDADPAPLVAAVAGTVGPAVTALRGHRDALCGTAG